jgi:hypothetical protein
VPGTYQVALVVNGSVADTKPMRIIMDPAVSVTMAEAQRRRYNEIVLDLHDMQRRATEVAGALNALHPQMADVATKIANVPADAKSQFEALSREFEAVRVKFGVPLAAPGGGRGGGGGGGRGGGAPDPNNVLGRVGVVKGSIMSFWEMPSDALVKQYNDVKAAVPRAVSEANAVLARATAVSQALKAHNVTLTVPSVGTP